MEGYGRYSGVNNFCAGCGRQEQEQCQWTLLEENNKGQKVSGSRDLPSERFWNKSKEVRVQIAVPRETSWLLRNEDWLLGGAEGRI